MVERYTVSHAAGYFLTGTAVGVVVVVDCLVVDVVVVFGAVTVEDVVQWAVVIVIDGIVEDDVDGNTTALVEIDDVAAVVVTVDFSNDDVDEGSGAGMVVLAAVDAKAALSATGVETGVVVTAAEVAGLPPCGQVHHAAHTTPHSTNKAAVIDSHRIGRCLGVGMTRFSVSAVIQRGQKRAPGANIAPQCGHVFIPVLPQRF